METGIYRKKQIDWNRWEVDVFTPHLYSSGSFYGCGATALALLSGIPPLFIENNNKTNPSHWKDSFMVKFLKSNGFHVKHITKCDVSNLSSNVGYASDFVSNRHVILMSQLMNKNSASWAVVHNKLWYHNFQIGSFSSTTLLNMPTLTTYLVLHPTWKCDKWIDKFKK